MQPLSNVLTDPRLLTGATDEAAEKLIFVLGQEARPLVLAAPLTKEAFESDAVRRGECEAVGYAVNRRQQWSLRW